jgi:hypothetical protein
MILGYVDANDRLYDLNFATLRMKMRIEPVESGPGAQVVFAATGGAREVAYPVLGAEDVTAEVAMDHDGKRIPLLRPVPGKAYRHRAGILFIAAPTARDPEDPTFFLVKLRAMPSAVKFFFEDQEGTEIVSIPLDEVLRMGREGNGHTVYVSAASVALPKEKIAYAVQFRPAGRVARLLEGLPANPAR